MKRVNKFSARATVLDGIVFDSQKEANRWAELRLLERAGAISHLERQVTINLAPPVKLHGEKRTKPALRAVIDFRYFENGERIFEDTKGIDTPVSRMKRHLLKAQHNIDVRIV